MSSKAQPRHSPTPSTKLRPRFSDKRALELTLNRRCAFLAWTLLALVTACSSGTAETTAIVVTDDSTVITEGTGSTVTVGEDCESNIAAIQALVDEGGTYNDLSAAEQADATALLGAATTLCSVDRRQEFSSRDDVATWLGNSD